MDKTALILVDIQNDYFPGGKMILEGVEPACANAARLLQHFRDKRLPVLHVRHLVLQPGATFFLPDTPGSEIHPSVAPMPGEAVVVKHFPNSFRETTLLDQLKKVKVASVAVCGAMSHMCIDATVRAACDLGFQCLVSHDACATRALTFVGSVGTPLFLCV
jgi:nicotinamidase-related amidase